MIISLYAGGMTIRDIQHHLARTIGTELSHETDSDITDAILEEVKTWQSRPLEEIYPIIYLDALPVLVRDGHHHHATRPVTCGNADQGPRSLPPSPATRFWLVTGEVSS